MDSYPSTPVEQMAFETHLKLATTARVDAISAHNDLLHDPLEKRSNLLLKRCFDLVMATILIMLILPWLLPIVFLLIKADSKGPVFFLQKRQKKDGKLFTCIKFRTMANLAVPDGIEIPRITGIGKFLRLYHIDELPQLFNVFIGDMSLIGPRPHMIADNHRFEKMVNGYHIRHKVKPGITGLAQVAGHTGQITCVESIQNRVACDIDYIKNWSPLLDVRIAWRTIFKIIGAGRYSPK